MCQIRILRDNSSSSQNVFMCTQFMCRMSPLRSLPLRSPKSLFHQVPRCGRWHKSNSSLLPLAIAVVRILRCWITQGGSACGVQLRILDICAMVSYDHKTTKNCCGSVAMGDGFDWRVNFGFSLIGLDSVPFNLGMWVAVTLTSVIAFRFRFLFKAAHRPNLINLVSPLLVSRCEFWQSQDEVVFYNALETNDGEEIKTVVLGRNFLWQFMTKKLSERGEIWRKCQKWRLS